MQFTDDVAHQILEKYWRIPTDEEMTKLVSLENNLSWEEDYLSLGLNGYLVRNKETGNYVFIPTAGYRAGTDLNDVGVYGNYWSSKLSTLNVAKPWRLCFNPSSAWTDETGGRRFHGFTIRPVTE